MTGCTEGVGESQQGLRAPDAGEASAHSARDLPRSPSGLLAGDDAVGGQYIYWTRDQDIVASRYEVASDEIVVDGDISLGPTEEAWREHGRLAERLRRGLATDEDDNKGLVDSRNRRLWDDGVIRFEFNSTLRCSSPTDTSPGCQMRQLVQTSINRWNELTPITGLRWAPANLHKRNSGVLIVGNTGGKCFSELGLTCSGNFGPAKMWDAR